MNKIKKRKLERNGWKVGSAEQFLELTDEEAAFVKLKLALARELRVRRSRSSR
jgi:hypothetical protein